MEITVNITAAEALALDTVMIDKQNWLTNAITNRARVAKDAFKNSPKWMQAAQALTVGFEVLL